MKVNNGSVSREARVIFEWAGHGKALFFVSKEISISFVALMITLLYQLMFRLHTTICRSTQVQVLVLIQILTFTQYSSLNHWRRSWIFCCRNAAKQFDEQELVQNTKRQRLDLSTQKLVPITSCKPERPQSFAAPKSEDDIAKVKRSAIPNKTYKDTNYCITIWNEWCKHRSAVVKPAVHLLQIQEVHPGPHSNACNFCRFYLYFHTCPI